MTYVPVPKDLTKVKMCIRDSFHPRYALGDHHNYIDKDDFLREMYLNTVGNNERCLLYTSSKTGKSKTGKT